MSTDPLTQRTITWKHTLQALGVNAALLIVHEPGKRGWAQEGVDSLAGMPSVGEVVKAVTEWPARYFFALGLVAAGLLLASQGRWATALGFEAASPWWRLALTTTTLAFVAIGLTKTGANVATWLRNRDESREHGKAFEAEMRSLTPPEYAVLALFVDQDQRTASLLRHAPLANAARALCQRRRLSALGTRFTPFGDEATYSIPDEVLEFFRSHPDLLEPGRRLNG
jgi:hypothetical protein